jgi:hypothetical protein
MWSSRRTPLRRSVAVGALSASAQIYAIGARPPGREIGTAWNGAMARPVPPVMVAAPPLREVVITGRSA